MTTTVKERPIMFSVPMVRAILAGTKTQTRRPVKPSNSVAGAGYPWSALRFDDGRVFKDGLPSSGEYLHVPVASDARWGDGIVDRVWPRIDVGEHLWVRETWGPLEGGICYRADREPDQTWLPDDGRWHSSLHMHRAFSRITLEVVALRIERLREISESDAKAEGFGFMPIVVRHHGEVCGGGGISARDQYLAGWDAMYAKKPEVCSDANPFVWVIEFRRIGGAT